MLFKDLWLSTISYNYAQLTNQSDVITELYSKAIRQLNEDLVEEFMQKFCLLKIRINNQDTSSYNKDVEDMLME